jgi:hypothetical protein
MSTQVIRVEGYSKGSLTCIGNECDRKEGIEHRNSDINPERTSLNQSYKDVPEGNSFYREHAQMLMALNAQYNETKKGIAFEGMLITADFDFFHKMGYTNSTEPPKEVQQFFDNSYQWALEQIGYNGTDKNIISAKVHYDEKTPHLHIYYLPLTDKWQEKVYAKGDGGKVLRSDKGTPLQAKDENGKIIYKQIEDKTAPKLSRTEFWRQKGGKVSYRRMQDDFQERIGKAYGLERGEIGSDREHETKYQYKQKQLAEELKQYSEMKIKTDSIDENGKNLPFGKSVVDTKAFERIKKQAKAYAVNRDSIKALKSDQDELKQQEKELSSERAALAAQQKNVQEAYQRQLNINQLLERCERELSEEKNRTASLTNENTSLRLAVTDKDKTIKELKETNRGAYESLTNVCKAVGMLKYDKNGEYKADLTPQQERLVDGVANYSAYWAKKDGHPDLAEEINKKIGISAGIKTKIQELTPQEHISRGGR